MSDGSADHVIHDVPQYHRVPARWVPRQLTPERVDACEELLRRLKAKGDGFLSRIVTADSTWVHYHQGETRERPRQGVIPHHQTQGVPDADICREDYTDSLLG
jgi:hypothetical protein